MDLLRILFLVFFTLIAFRAKSYEVTIDFKEGMYWTILPIKMYRYVLDSSMAEDLKNATEVSEDDWESNVGQDLWEFVGDVGVRSGGMLVNNIRWSDNFGNETGYDPSTTLAITIRFNNGSIFTKTEVILNGNHNNLRNNIGGMLLNTVMHELGHTIGLDHTNQYAIMAPYSNDLRALQYDDIEGGKYVYKVNASRQSSGYSEYLSNKKRGGIDQIGACGSIDITSGGDESNVSFMSSLFLGLLATFGWLLFTASFSKRKLTT
jgi:hypothetical protein